MPSYTGVFVHITAKAACFAALPFNKIYLLSQRIIFYPVFQLPITMVTLLMSLLSMSD